MKRYGTVLTFAPGVSASQANAALKKFVDENPGLLAKDYFFGNSTNEFRLEEFDDKYGGPVWYIP